MLVQAKLVEFMRSVGPAKMKHKTRPIKEVVTAKVAVEPLLGVILLESTDELIPISFGAVSMLVVVVNVLLLHKNVTAIALANIFMDLTSVFELLFSKIRSILTAQKSSYKLRDISWLGVASGGACDVEVGCIRRKDCEDSIFVLVIREILSHIIFWVFSLGLENFENLLVISSSNLSL